MVFCTGAGMSGDLGFGAGFAEACRGALQAGFRQGAAGYARDTVLASRPGRGGWRRSRLPRCRREVVPGVGSAVLWTHAAQILAALIEDRDVG